MKLMDNDFAISSISDEKALPQLKYDYIFEDKLNQNLSIKNYSSTIEGLGCIFQAIEPDDISTPPKDVTKHLPEYNVVKLYLILNYNKFINANAKEHYK